MASKQSFTKTEIKAGMLVLGSAVVLALFTAAVLGLRPPAPMKTFYADFVNVKGLHKGSEVDFGGLKVGRVQALGLLPGRHSRIRVAFRVPEDVPVNVKSKVSIAQMTLTSDNHVEVSTGEDGARLAKNGAVLSSQEGGLFDLAGLLAQDVRTLLGDVRTLVGVKGESAGKLVSIEDLFHGVQNAVNEGTGAVRDVRSIVSDNRDKVNQIVEVIEPIETSAAQLVKDLNGVLSKNRSRIDQSVDNVRRTTARVEEASRKLNAMAQSLQNTLNSTSRLSGNAQDLLAKARPDIEDIILDLRETVEHLNDFSRTIEEQPESILRGTKPQGRRR